SPTASIPWPLARPCPALRAPRSRRTPHRRQSDPCPRPDGTRPPPDRNDPGRIESCRRGSAPPTSYRRRHRAPPARPIAPPTRARPGADRPSSAAPSRRRRRRRSDAEHPPDREPASWPPPPNPAPAPRRRGMPRPTTPRPPSADLGEKPYAVSLGILAAADRDDRHFTLRTGGRDRDALDRSRHLTAFLVLHL